MPRNPFGARAAGARSWLTPRNLLLAGAAVNGLAVVLAMAEGSTPVPLRVGLILVGLALAIIGVNHRLRNFAEALDERATTAAYLALGAFDVLLAYLASSEEWDTFRMVLGAFVGVGLAAAVLVLLPQLLRRVAIVALVVFHFAGILTAVFSVAPPTGVGNWMAGALWTNVYRPYLQFMYLNNAYHFYSPEPGPATQLWFRVSYDPASKVPPRWFQFPRREDFASPLLYQRSLAMTESTTTNRLPGNLPPDFFGTDGRLMARHRRAWFSEPRVPYAANMQADKSKYAAPDLAQYQEPADLAKKYLASYARHVAHDPKFRDPDHPGAEVVKVKVYRVKHNFLTPNDLAKGLEYSEPSVLMPVYVGEYDAEGHLLDPRDPLLYWVVPIQREKDENGEFRIKDFVAVHAGDDHSVLVMPKE